MDFISKLKETLISVLPIVLVVLILNFTIVPIGDAFVPFLIGSVLLVLGLSLFLGGTELGMVPVGEKLGSVLAHKQSLPLLLGLGFVVGFGVTFAEPDVNVLASQIHSLNPQISEKFLVFCISVGLGIFVDIGLFRSVKQIPLRNILLIFYLLILVLVPFIGQRMGSIAFDASGATTGPLAVPFLLALGLGVSSASKEGKDSSFGLTGIASIGPIIAVVSMALLTRGSASSLLVTESSEGSLVLERVFVAMLKKTATGFGPLAGMIIVLQFVLLKFPRVKFKKICFGIVYSFVGIVLFLTGVEYGFSHVGNLLGHALISSYSPWLVVATGVLFGAIVVCAEPAVWVLTSQVEQVTVGRIKRSLVLGFLCFSVALAVGLAMIRIVYNINYLWFVYIEVGIALALTFFCPPLFSGIAFDSGGVASGPMSTSFLLSFAMGVSGSAEMGFGLVGLIALSPLIAIQILGVIYKFKENKMTGGSV